MTKKVIEGIFCNMCGRFIKYTYDKYTKSSECIGCGKHLCEKCTCEINVTTIKRHWKESTGTLPYGAGGTITSPFREIKICEDCLPSDNEVLDAITTYIKGVGENDD